MRSTFRGFTFLLGTTTTSQRHYFSLITTFIDDSRHEKFDLIDVDQRIQWIQHLKRAKVILVLKYVMRPVLGVFISSLDFSAMRLITCASDPLVRAKTKGLKLTFSTLVNHTFYFNFPKFHETCKPFRYIWGAISTEWIRTFQVKEKSTKSRLTESV